MVRGRRDGRVEACQLTAQAGPLAPPERDPSIAQVRGQVAVEEREQRLSREGVRVAAGFAERQPQPVARQRAAGPDRQLDMEVIEAAAIHAAPVRPLEPQRTVAAGPRKCRVFRAAAAGLLAAGLGCADLGSVAVPPEALAPLSARVERARGAPFEGPVRARRLESRRVADELARELDQTLEPGDLAADAALGVALGFLPPGTDLRDVLLSFGSSAIAGFYAVSSGTLFLVRGAAPAGGGGTETVLVHELAHAWQHQTGAAMSGAFEIRENDDLVFALGALLEGDALWTEFEDARLEHGLPLPEPAEFAKRFRAELGLSDTLGDIPRYIRESTVEQYPLGYALVHALWEAGGLAALAAAQDDPPLSSEELLHPERYLTRERRPIAWFPERPWAFAPLGCEVRTSSSFGEFGVRILLEDAGLPAADARAAAEGWDGDRAWLAGCPDGAAVAWLLQMDDPEEAAELEAAWRAIPFPGHVPGRGAARIDRRGTRVLVSVGTPPPTRSALLEATEARRVGRLREALEAMSTEHQPEGTPP